MPRPGLIVVLGLVASLQPAEAAFVVSTDLGLVARGAAAGAVGVAFALAVSLAGPSLRAIVDLDRFRFGSAVALGMLPLSMFELIPADAPLALAVLGVTALLAFDPADEDEDAGPTLDNSPMGTGGAFRPDPDAEEERTEDGAARPGVTGDPGLAQRDEDGHAPWL
jgi:hypothetical protein